MQPGSNSPALEKLKKFTNEIVYNPLGRPLKEEELIPLLKDCDGYIAGLDNVTDKVIGACDRLKVISRYGAGVDRVDLKAAHEKNVKVTNTPGVNAEAVAELTMGLVLSLARKIPYLDYQTKNNKWVRSSGIELRGKTMGILGLGAIGKDVAAIAQGFSMKVVAYDPYWNGEYASAHGIAERTFEELIREADVISLHLPILPSTRHMIDRKAMENMKPGVIIVNASRGGIIDEQAACEFLKSGRIGGLGLDAFEVEPPQNLPLFGFENVVVTPHTGAHTKEATLQMADLSVENLIHVLSGQPCSYIMN